MARYLLLPLLALGCAAAPLHATELAPGRYEKKLTSEGVERRYIVRVPAATAPEKGLPLVIVLHGWTGSAKLAEIYTGMGEAADKRGYVSVFPDGLGNQQGWNAGFIDLSGQKKDDVAFVSSVIDSVTSEVRIDPKRIYVCGHSNGAFLSHYIGSKIGNRLAAIGAVAGTIGFPIGGPSRRIPDPAAPLSVILLHGEKDETVAFGPLSKSLLKGIGAVESAEWWAKQDGCGVTPVVEKTATSQTTRYTGGKNGTEVELVTFPNGTHAWPGGRTLSGPEQASGGDAAKLLLDFFDRHPRRD